MTAASTERAELARTMARDARELPDAEFEGRLAEAIQEVAKQRRQLEVATAWRDTLDAEKDRRSVQRRVG